MWDRASLQGLPVGPHGPAHNTSPVPMELYGMWCSPLVLGPITVLGCLAQLHVWRDLAYPTAEKPLPRGEETQEGWAALPEELLSRIMALAKGAPGPLLFATYGSTSLRGVCRSWCVPSLSSPLHCSLVLTPALPVSRLAGAACTTSA